MRLLPTASQTVGPYLHLGLTWNTTTCIAGSAIAGEHITIQGQIIDGNCEPVPDALLEVWQANSYGKYAHPEDVQDKPLEPGFRGFGRIPTNDRGEYRFSTIKPGVVPGPDGPQAPHLLISIFMRGLYKQLVTRMYFPDDDRNCMDKVLESVPIDRRTTLIAKKLSNSKLLWNVVLQGDSETVFFDC